MDELIKNITRCTKPCANQFLWQLKSLQSHNHLKLKRHVENIRRVA